MHDGPVSPPQSAAVHRLLLAILLVGCDTLDTGVAWVTDHGEVYECQATATDVLELCTQLSERALERDTGWSCEPTSRLWPRVTGCVYNCSPHAGCNAHAGCYCPDPH